MSQLASTVTPFGVSCAARVLPSDGTLHRDPSLRKTKCMPAESGTFPAGPEGGVIAFVSTIVACFCSQIFQPIRLATLNVKRIAAAMAACIIHNAHAFRCFCG